MDTIELVPYDPVWPDHFRAERDRLDAVLPHAHVLDIVHGGSTAILGPAAKPIIDIFIGVHDVDAARADFVAPITGIGYVYWAENPDNSRLFFVKGMPPYGEGRTHHIHVMQAGSAAWQRALLFRDYLRNHPDEAQRYVDLKRELVRLHADDREAYTRAKDAYISGVVATAQRLQSNSTGGTP